MVSYTQHVGGETATIALSAALSNAVYIAGNRLVAIEMPSAWTAAKLTFQASWDGTTFTEVLIGATALELTVAASQTIMLDVLFTGALYVKVRSGTAASPVNQAAARDVRLIVAPAGL